MILIDSRRGSGELAKYFKSYGIDTGLTTLEFGDFCFSGNGPDNSTVNVGIERKRIDRKSNDLVQSIQSKRLSGFQLPGLLNTYDYVYLLVEGVYKSDEHGRVVTFNSRYRRWELVHAGSRVVTFRELDHYFTTLNHLCNVHVIFAGVPERTAELVVSRYKWWNDKKWSQHKSHIEVYAPYTRQGRKGMMQHSAGIVEKMAAQIYGVDKKAFDIAKKFKTPFELITGRTATKMDYDRLIKVWRKVTGKALTESAVKQITGR